MALDPDELIDHIRDNSTATGDIIDMARYCNVPLYVDEELHSGGEGDDEDLTAHCDVQAGQSQAEFTVLQPDGMVPNPLEMRGSDRADTHESSHKTHELIASPGSCR